MSELKLDTLGRRNKGWLKHRGGRPAFLDKIDGKYICLTTRLDSETMQQVKAKAKVNNLTLADQVRMWIEWGLENDE